MNAIVAGGGWLLYADGARREINIMGALIEPPDNEYEKHKLLIQYHTTKLALVVEEFQTHKNNLLLHAKAGLRDKCCPPPPANKKEAIVKLKQLKEKVQAYQLELSEARKGLEKNKPASLQQRENVFEQNRLDNENFVGELEKIEI
jgi:hypothetical protein